MEGDDRFHCGECQQLQQVVLNHVPQCARFVVIRGAIRDTGRFCSRDLHLLDVTPIPDRLEDPVRKAEYQKVLNGFFSQVVVNPVDLSSPNTFSSSSFSVRADARS